MKSYGGRRGSMQFPLLVLQHVQTHSSTPHFISSSGCHAQSQFNLSSVQDVRHQLKCWQSLQRISCFFFFLESIGCLLSATRHLLQCYMVMLLYVIYLGSHMTTCYLHDFAGMLFSMQSKSTNYQISLRGHCVHFYHMDYYLPFTDIEPAHTN